MEEQINEAEIILIISTLKDISNKLKDKQLPENYDIIICYGVPCKTDPCTGDCCRTFTNCNENFGKNVAIQLIKTL